MVEGEPLGKAVVSSKNVPHRSDDAVGRHSDTCQIKYTLPPLEATSLVATIGHSKPADSHIEVHFIVAQLQ